MVANDLFAIDLFINRQPDGRVYVYSPDVPGLHLAGHSLEAVKEDIDPAVRDLLLHNRKIVVDHIEWVPSLDRLTTAVEHGGPQPEGDKPKLSVLLLTAHAA